MNVPNKDKSTAAMEAIGHTMSGHDIDDLLPALCWLLGEVGAQYTDDREGFMNLVNRTVASAYDINSLEVGDDTQIH